MHDSPSLCEVFTFTQGKAMSQESQLVPIVEIGIRDYGTNSFYSISEIESWLNQEVTNWGCIATSTGDVLPKAQNFLREILRDAKKDGVDVAEVENRFVQAFKTRMEQLFGSNEPRIFYSGSATGQSILSLPNEERLAAWKIATKQQVAAGNGTFLAYSTFAGSVKAVLFQEGIVTSAEAAALKAMREEWQRIFEAHAASFNSQSLALKNKISESSESNASFSAQMAKADKAHAELCQRHEKEMSTIKKTFRDYLTLSKPAKYWKRKRIKHQESQKLWAKIAGGYGIVALSVVLFALPRIAQWGLPVDIDKLIRDGIISDRDGASLLTHFGIVTTLRFLAGTLLLAWPLRIFLRNYLSHSHLAADASERQVVIGTYLALTDNPELSQKPDVRAQVLQQALQNIFRHSEDGIVRDDAMPSAAEWLATAGKLR